MDPPRPTRAARLDDLTELLGSVRRELLLRQESPTGAWVEETAAELRSGKKWGTYYPPGTNGGIGFRTERGENSFAHVHVDGGTNGMDRAARLTESLIESLPETLRTVTVGFTGLTTEEERALRARLSERPGSTVIERYAMERALVPDDAHVALPAPEGLAHVAVRDVSLEALAELDRRAFAGTTDELLIGPTLEDSRRVVSAMLAGEAGHFLDDASTTLYRAEPPTLAGALLSCERSARHAVFLDFMVDPPDRGRGYGTYLLRWGFRTLWALGYEHVRLWVTASNRTARALYDRVGFAVTHTTLLYRWERPGTAPHPHRSP
jgi:ribosomal protein S18 acetylase RimI-like enzyme